MDARRHSDVHRGLGIEPRLCRPECRMSRRVSLRVGGGLQEQPVFEQYGLCRPSLRSDLVILGLGIEPGELAFSGCAVGERDGQDPHPEAVPAGVPWATLPFSADSNLAVSLVSAMSYPHPLPVNPLLFVNWAAVDRGLARPPRPECANHRCRL